MKLDLMHQALEGEFLYVLDCDQNFHVYPLELTTQTGSKDPKYDFWRSLALRKHNQFLNGDPLICAGECTIQNGKIYEIDNNSGHYLPSPFNLRQCVEMLNHHQVLSDKGGVTIINGSEIIYKTFSKFLSSKPMIRKAFTSEALNQMSMHSLEKGFKKARKHQAAYLIQKAWKQFKAKEQEHRPAA